MAKDPAFLFYASDFLTGTMTMTDEQVGKYTRLLCLQHQKGTLSEKDMLFICKSHDEDIFSKFIKDGNTFYNARLRAEMERRASYSLSRSNNRKSKNISKTYVQHMETVTETITENENKEGVIGETKVLNGKNVNGDPIFFDFETMRKSDYWQNVKENVCRKTFKSLSSDQKFLLAAFKDWDLKIMQKGEWSKGVTPSQFQAGVIRSINNGWFKMEEKKY